MSLRIKEGVEGRIVVEYFLAELASALAHPDSTLELWIFRELVEKMKPVTDD